MEGTHTLDSTSVDSVPASYSGSTSVDGLHSLAHSACQQQSPRTFSMQSSTWPRQLERAALGPAWVCSASSGIWQEALPRKDHCQYLLGAWMFPLRAQEANPCLSGMEESFSAHRLGQMGLVPGDKLVPLKRHL